MKVMVEDFISDWQMSIWWNTNSCSPSCDTL